MSPKLILTFFLFGLSFGAGPCLASCGPLLLSYIVGTKKDIRASLLAYLAFSLSRIAIYVIIGFSVFSCMQMLARYEHFITIASGIFLIIVGALIALGKAVSFKICQRAQDTLLRNDLKTIVVLGVITGIAPCAPLISIISYVGITAKHWLHSLVYSLAFGIGTAVSPLLFLVVVAGIIPGLIKNQERFQRIFNLVSGAVIILLGVLLLRRLL
ncbi:MAG: sulfite exporter TauE/SafE family protein [Candidatus Omnitrophica bacterium]|nr:sulfite exporter TauE/SafE family protein [Candidatus Omnitrophota bacterium]